MIVDDDLFSDPPSYPKSGTYSDLLFWHLEIWGTGNGGDMAHAGERWHPRDFLEKVILNNFDFDSDRPSLENWLGRKGPPARPTDRNIENALFGPPPAFQKWRLDLREAHSRSRGKDKDGQYRNRRTVNFDLAVRGPITTADVPAIVSIGGRNFAHRQLHKLKADPTNLNELLRTDVRATTLVQRVDELAMLASWRDAPQGIAVKCVIGAAGAGKTRLAIEACEAAEEAGWFATFIPSSELLASNMAQPPDSLVQPTQTLIVVDYAATSAKSLKDWFCELAIRRNRPDHKLRILLLERHADSQYGWWNDLLRPDSNDHAYAADLIGTEIPHALPPFDAILHRRALLAEVMLKAAPLFDPPRPALILPAPDVDLWFDQRLAENKHDNEPLYLMMAGICAVESGVATALAMNRLDLARRMATFEKARLRKFAKARGFTDEGKLLTHIAACVSLQNGCDPTQLPALVKAERSALDVKAPFDDETIAEILCDFLPILGKVDAVRPDLIGESFCLPFDDSRRVRNRSENTKIVLRCWQRDPAGTIDTLIRCALDLALGNGDHPSVHFLQVVIEASDDITHLAAIAEALPTQTLALGELAAKLLGVIVEHHRMIARAEPEAGPLALAESLRTLAIYLCNLGRSEEALGVAEEALALWRPLAASRPDAFMPNLAKTLNNLAIYLYDLGRREEALGVAEEALALWRPLAASRPDAFMPNLAKMLNNLAMYLYYLGRRKEALGVVEESLALWRPLAASRPDPFMLDLAVALSSLANIFSDLGRREEALRAAEEAVALCRPLAASRPDPFMMNLAVALSSLANIFNDLGRREEALGAAEEAVALCRSMAAERPDAFVHYLANSLFVLGDALEGNHRIAEAVTQDHAAIAVFAPHFFMMPQAFGTTMRSYVLDYIRRAEVAKVELDRELVTQISDCLRSIGLFISGDET